VLHLTGYKDDIAVCIKKRSNGPGFTWSVVKFFVNNLLNEFLHRGYKLPKIFHWDDHI
jgi:hypothetical protein